MDGGRKLTVALALIVLICFFLPWVQVSCGGVHDTSTGVDLARGGDNGLWLIPLLMVVVISCGLVRLLAPQRVLFGLLSLLSGLIATYLMNHERLRFADTSILIAVSLTGWYWLAFVAAIAMVPGGIVAILKRPQAAP